MHVINNRHALDSSVRVHLICKACILQRNPKQHSTQQREKKIGNQSRAMANHSAY